MTLKKTLQVTLAILLVCYTYSSNAAEVDFSSAIEASSISIPEYVSLEEDVLLDIKDVDIRLSEAAQTAINFRYSWEVSDNNSDQAESTEIRFDSYGEKKVSLNIYDLDNDDTLLYSQGYDVFVYRQSFPLLISDTIPEQEIDDFSKNAKNVWVYIHKIWTYSEDKLDGANIISSLEKYKLSTKNISDYLNIWWEKEFLLSAISKIGTQSEASQIKNFVLTSSYNASVLQNYLWNSLAWENFIDTAFILSESASQRIIKNPQNISKLLEDLESNNYNYTSLSDGVQIPKILFASNFVNTLARSGISTSDLYIILLLPLFLTAVAVAKHLIGLSTLGSIIPVFIAILFIKINIFFVLALMAFLLISNIFIGVFINKYTLLYTPKVACMTILNLIIFMIFYQIWMNYELLGASIDNILYIIIFFIIAEKLITVITSKEFREYKKSLSWTIIVSLACAGLYYLDPLVVFLTAYPEVLILLVPFNFFLGRFTGLRVTEYLRFREIVKNIEE